MTYGRTIADTDEEPEDALAERALDAHALYALARHGRLWAVFDLAGALPVYEHLMTFGVDQAVPLARGDAAERYAAVTPWVARVDPTLCDWIAATLLTDPAQADSWGLFVVARSRELAIDELRHRLLALFTVRLPEGDIVRFRFYDPRVLPPVLEGSARDDLHRICGPEIAGFAVVEPTTGGVTLYHPEDRPPHLPWSKRIVLSPHATPDVAPDVTPEAPAPVWPLGVRT